MNGSRWRLALAVSFFLNVAAGMGVQPIPESYRFFDGTQHREYELALDEVHQRGQRNLRRIPPQKDAQSLQRAARAFNVMADGTDLVVYPKGAVRTERNRRILTRHVLVRLEPGAGEAAVLAGLEAQVIQRFDYLPDHLLVEAPGAGEVIQLAEALRQRPGIISAEPQLARRTARKLIPNDTYLSSHQWHLRNTGQLGGTSGIDINITNVWNTYRGAGVMIGIVDDGLQLHHPDLAANINTAIDRDFNYNDNDPSPDVFWDWHGTAVAGVAAARGNNSTGVAGAAYEATLVGLRLIALFETDAQDAAAMAHSNAVIHIKNNSWGAPDCEGNPVLEGAGPLMRAAIRDGVRNGRGGKGVIYTWAGGNGRECNENVNYDGFANQPEVFAIGAVSDQGLQADYSEPGACLVASAPSSSEGRAGIATTDLTGNDGYNGFGATGELPNTSYTRTFGGTSSAAPLAAGVIALVLQANPNLSYRDVKEVLLRSATKVQSADTEWRTNAAGIPHHHRFGAGMINAQAAVTLATNWARLGPVTNLTLLQTNLDLAIPDNHVPGISRTLGVTNANFRVEAVTLTLTTPHANWGDLAVTLVSPSGIQSRLAEPHNADTTYRYQAWTFSSVRHWGEQAEGIWTVNIADRRAGTTGSLNAIELTLFGSRPEARLTLSSAGTNLHIQLAAPAAGWRYALESAANISASSSDWSPLTTVMVPSIGRVAHTHTNAFSSERRFYRARLLP